MRPTWWLLASLALGSPIESEPQNLVRKSSWTSTASINDLEREFLGIFWDRAGETCSEDQMEALVKATRAADTITSYVMRDGTPPNNPSWNRYFVNDEPGNFQQSWSSDIPLYFNLINNMKAVNEFPKRGKKRNTSRLTRVTFRCASTDSAKQQDVYSENDKRCVDTVGGFTTPIPMGDDANFEWQISFCPYFFTLKPIEWWTSQKDLQEDILLRFSAQELVVIHELMHANVIGTKVMINDPSDRSDTGDKHQNIIDVEASPPPFENQPKKGVYGDVRTHGFAWQYVGDDKKSINPKVALNADNYAWFFVHSWLRNFFEWSDDGTTNFHSTKRGENDDLTYDDDGLVDVDDIVIDASDPGNCQMDSDGVPQCTYVEDSGITATATDDPQITSTTTGASTTSAPCEVQSFQVATGTEPFCACSTTSGTDTVTSTITTPSGGKCADYTAFPTTGFMAKPTITGTAYNEMCQFNFGEESKDGYCACQTTVSDSATSQWVPLPYTMGSYTVLDCHDITSVDFTSTSSTPTTSATKTFITDYTSTDIGNGNVWVFPTAFATVGTKNWAGDADFTGVPETLGVGTATFEKIPNYLSTDGLTSYYYAEATGNGDGNVVAVGTPTATALPSPTQNCIRYVIPGPDSGGNYNSKLDQYVFVLYGISGWNDTQYDEKINGLLENCGVKKDISVEENTAKWGNVAMWNSGRGWDMNACISEGFWFLGAESLKNETCGGGLPNMNVNLEVKASASEDMDYIYENFSGYVSSPYPLQT